uniref:Transcription factor protein n=1 Tax=Ciona intestinalis TaxID=7719 RepID=Q4H351_CIOIN|nr:transcription factor protein isoform 1 [Ciona intestinalis]BAE06576.1 transcription factor protein [Ciona intestinalis]|eukprot:NP_001071770.1 transcription factor protein isoform 1 [Ciona intestinalis]
MQVIRNIPEKKNLAFGLLDIGICLAILQLTNVNNPSDNESYIEDIFIGGPMVGIIPYQPLQQRLHFQDMKVLDDYEYAMSTYRSIIRDVQTRIPTASVSQQQNINNVTAMMLRVGRTSNAVERNSDTEHRNSNVSSFPVLDENRESSGLNYTVPRFDVFNETQQDEIDTNIVDNDVLTQLSQNLDDVRWRCYINDPSVRECLTLPIMPSSSAPLNCNESAEYYEGVQTHLVLSEEFGSNIGIQESEDSASDFNPSPIVSNQNTVMDTYSKNSLEYEPEATMSFDYNSQIDVTYLEDSDMMQLMYQQDVDLGFRWPSRDPVKNLDEIDEVLNMKKTTDVGEFFVDGETGEQIPISKVQNNSKQQELNDKVETSQAVEPSTEPTSSYFSIDEYLEILNESIDDIQPQVVEQTNLNQISEESIIIEDLTDLLTDNENGSTMEQNNAHLWQDMSAIPQLPGKSSEAEGQLGTVNVINTNVSLTNATVESNQTNENTLHQQGTRNINLGYKPVAFENEQPFATQPYNVYKTPAFNPTVPCKPAFSSPSYNTSLNGEDGIPMDGCLSLPIVTSPQGLLHNQINSYQAPMETGDSPPYDEVSPVLSFHGEPGSMFFDEANVNEMLDDIINMNSMNQVYNNSTESAYLNMNPAVFVPPPLQANPPQISFNDTKSLDGSTSDQLKISETCDSDSGVSMSPHSFYMGHQRMERDSIDNETSLHETSFATNALKVINHNHTYDGTVGKPRIIKKKPDKSASHIRESRDERKARELNIPFTLDEIIMSPVEEYNEMLARTPLTTAQQTLIKDIRRRGKNKVAAQNCRKRKIETITTMEEDVDVLRGRKNDLEMEQDELEARKQNLKSQYNALYQQIFRSLRDESGRPYDPSLYTLEQVEGAVLLVPRNLRNRDHNNSDHEDHVDFTRVKMEKRD